MIIMDLVLIFFIVVLLVYVFYDQFIMFCCNGFILFFIVLFCCGCVDSVIFVGLVVIFIYNNVISYGVQMIIWLLSVLVLMGFYIFWICMLWIIFK